MNRSLILHLSLLIVHATFSNGATHHIAIDPSDSRDDIIRKAAELTPSKAQMLHHLDEYNGFIHFGPNTFTRVSDWGSGKEDPKVFNPPSVDTDQWCRIMKESGMRKVVITVKHHEGFCIWQTRYNKEFSVHQSPWKNGKGDVLRSLSESCKKYGLKLGVYLSPADLYQMESPTGIYGNESKYRDSIIPTDPETFQTNPMKQRKVADGLPTFKVSADDYNRYFMNQLYELLTDYGPIHEVWFDGAHPKRKGGQKYIRVEWIKMIRQLAPEAVIFGGPDARWCGNEHGGTRDPEWNVLTVDSLASSGYDRPVDDIGSEKQLLKKTYDVYGKTYQSNYLYYLVSEVDVSIRTNWFWRNDTTQHVRDADDVFDMYERSVGGNAVFLLNIPPNIDGKFSPRDEATLLEVGKRIKSTYGNNLAQGATSNAAGLFDNKLTTFWQPNKTSGSFTVTLPETRTVNRVVLQENIESTGQRVKTHALDAWVDNAWHEVATGTTIGYKKILRFQTVTTNRFRVRILDSRLAPTVATFSAHFFATAPLPVHVVRNAQGLVSMDAKRGKHQQAGADLTIRYTLDGSEPTEKSPTYSKPLDLPLGGSVKARSFSDNRLGPINTTQLGISQKEWKVVSFSSEHDDKYSANKAIDGNPATFWHTSWQTNRPHPHHLAIDLGKNYHIKGITYLPRQDLVVPDGMIESGSVELSKDGKTWHSAGNFKFGNIVNDPHERTFLFPKSGHARYIKLISKTGAQNKPYAGAAEIQVLAK